MIRTLPLLLCLIAGCSFVVSLDESLIREQVCDDGLDDDGDGQTDCFDADCRGDVACREQVCDDGLDNDGDEAIDCADDDCADDMVCERSIARCTDGLDNDQDALTDCADDDCLPVFDRNRDGKVDCNEPPCAGAAKC